MKHSILALFFLAAAGSSAPAGTPGRDPSSANPILPGYFADPSLVRHEGKFFLYATLDPWGGDTLGCWESPDFKNWTYRALNWPTKAACTGPDSGDAAVWAPSVLSGPDGKFHMFVSVGNEIWAGVSDYPLGPWRDAHGGKPLVPKNFRPGFHMIDAEGFVDDDGTPWLYWGSGHGWKNGKCWAVKLKPDMAGFDGEVHDVTPSNYFEGPFMVKRHGKYFLTYSQGITIKDTYQVHYAVGDTPLGPFTEGPGSPILSTNKAENVISPGHHAIFRVGEDDYILYHRHSIPFDPEFVGRQVCVDAVKFTADGRMEKVVPTHAGPPLARARGNGRHWLPAKATDSGQADPHFAAELAADHNNATRWRLPDASNGGWLQLDFGKTTTFRRQEIRFEYAWKPYAFQVQASDDGTTWQTLADHVAQPATGSPVAIEKPGGARYLRLRFPPIATKDAPSVFEWHAEP